MKRPALDWESLKRRTAESGQQRLGEQDLASIFAARAEALAREESEDDALAGSAQLCFAHAGAKLAVETKHVLRILPPRVLTRVPCAPEHLDRVLYEAGRIVSVVDLSLLFGRGRSAAAETRIVLLEVQSRWLGLRADEVLGPQRIDLAKLTVASSNLDSRIAASVRGLGSDMTIVLDAPLLVQSMHNG